MPRIGVGTGLCTVVVTVDAPGEVLPELEEHARDGLGRFGEFPGFVAGALHRSQDGTRLVQYLQWLSPEHHLACVNDPRWDRLPSAQRFLQLARDGTATVDVRTYEVVAAEDGVEPDHGGR